MTKIAVTQRVSIVREYGERRDCLDQAWCRFFAACGLLPVLIPNVPEMALELGAAADIAGLVLTGGNDLAALGGDAPERDATENALLDMAEAHGLPVLGVCRGMQLIQHRSAIPLQRVAGHITKHQVILVDGLSVPVNSYHNFAAFESRPPFEVWATAQDGVIKAIRHSQRPTVGIMWHPERMNEFAAADIALFRRQFKAS